MAKRKNNAEASEASAATLGYEAQLWQMADALRGSMDAAEYPVQYPVQVPADLQLALVSGCA